MSVFRAPDNKWINLLKVICLKDFVEWQMGGQSCLALQGDGENDITGWTSGGCRSRDKRIGISTS